MRVGPRLFLAVLPAVLGVITVAALAYWGQYAHAAPLAVVLAAAVAAVGSLVMAWYNTQYVARRVAQLAEIATQDVERLGVHITDQPHQNIAEPVHADELDSDELDSIESTVHKLSGAVARAREEDARREQAAARQAAEYATIAEEIIGVMAARLEEAELPLHVLLSSPFGSLNENQEEMLAAAQTAVATADEEVRRLKFLVDLDHGSIQVVPQPTGLAELLRPAIAIAEAYAHTTHVVFRASVSGTAPRVVADPVHAQAALTTVLSDAVRRTPAGSEVSAEAAETSEGGPGWIRITITHRSAAQPNAPSLEMRVATRLISLQSGSLLEEPGRTVIELPSERITSTRIGPITKVFPNAGGTT